MVSVAQRRAEIARVASNGGVEVERAACGELRRRERGDGLGHGADPHEGARRHRVARLDAADTECARVRDASIANDDHRRAGRAGTTHLAGEDRVHASGVRRADALGRQAGQHARRERGGGEEDHGGGVVVIGGTNPNVASCMHAALGRNGPPSPHSPTRHLWRIMRKLLAPRGGPLVVHVALLFVQPAGAADSAGRPMP